VSVYKVSNLALSKFSIKIVATDSTILFSFNVFIQGLKTLYYIALIFILLPLAAPSCIISKVKKVAYTIIYRD
jgi:hypothetical protein